MIAARLRLRIPEAAWVSELSRRYPDATFRLLSGMRRGDTAVEIGESYSGDPDAIAAAGESHPAVLDIEQIETTDRRSFAKYETTDTHLYDLFDRASMPPEFPVVVENGWAEFGFTGTREGFERLRAVLERGEHPYELVSLVESPDDADLLTDRQREVLETALRMGYLAVPRECTLAEVAGELGADKSTVSGVLRRAQARLAKRHLIAADSGTDEP